MEIHCDFYCLQGLHKNRSSYLINSQMVTFFGNHNLLFINVHHPCRLGDSMTVLLNFINYESSGKSMTPTARDQ